MSDLRNQLAAGAPQYAQQTTGDGATLGQDPYNSGKMSLIQGGNTGSRSNSMASTGNTHQQQHQNGKTFKQNAN